MSITGITPILSTNTFGQWKDVTNEIIESLEDAITIGDAEQNIGNLVITGNITASNTIITDTISPLNNAVDTITLTSFTAIEGNLSIDNVSGGVAKASFKDSGTTSWELTTNVDHSSFSITNGTSVLTLDGSTQRLTGTNILIDDAILPDAITATSITANLIGNVTGQVSDISNHNTGNLAEGSNLYFTVSRARASLVQGTGVSYNSTTGSISIGQSVGTTSSVTFASVTADDLKTGAWTIDEDGSGNLGFYHNGVLRFRMSTTGTLTADANITAYAF